ncbi:MAG TPA: TonB-dependent receptor [Terriglobales bacterium]|nr:TonB-dependent receptor [Terriglobales bacterium]
MQCANLRIVLAVMLLPGTAIAQARPRNNEPPRLPQSSFRVTIADENGRAVPDAIVTLTAAKAAANPAANSLRLAAHTDHSGRCLFYALPPGDYQIHVQKTGFYELDAGELRAQGTRDVDLVLAHQMEAREVVNVVESPPAIDAEQTGQETNLGTPEIVNIPYPSSRDIRNLLPFVPGVVQDPTGQVHVAGAESYQTLDLLDGFDIRSPVSGLLAMRVSADGVREVNVQSSRYSAEYGKASGGVVALNTGMGADNFRFTATNFPPSWTSKKGINFDKWVPRFTFSGPIRKGRAWFFDALDAEYDSNIVRELPDGADRAPVWRGSNLAKAQINLRPGNILTSSLLLNGYHSEGEGLSVFNPLETTLIRNQTAYLAGIKDQQYFSNGMLLEAGVAAVRFRDSFIPFGDKPYEVHPNGNSGNYFERSSGHSRRVEAFGKLYLPSFHAAGRHDFVFGLSADHIKFDQEFARRPIFVFREDGTLSRTSQFLPTAAFERNNFETGAYAQDRWSPAEHLLLELGLRFDWDQIVRRSLFSPRLASTYLLNSDTKISAGVGLYYDRTHLDFLARALTGPRLDTYFAADGTTPLGPPLKTTFSVDQAALQAPRFLNWSIGVERKLPAKVYASVEFIRKRGKDGFTFLNTNPATVLAGNYALTNDRRDHYDAVTISARKVFTGNYALFGAYTRSSARSNAVVDYTLTNPVFSPQAGGPLPWDTPNRFITWGWLPLPKLKRLDFVYSMEWRDGLPFSILNQDQRIVGTPNAARFPDFLSINPGLEWRFRFGDYQLALRGVIENVTAHSNPSVVNNDVDSPEFLTFSGFERRRVTARIRLLGKKK